MLSLRTNGECKTRCRRSSRTAVQECAELTVAASIMNGVAVSPLSRCTYRAIRTPPRSRSRHTWITESVELRTRVNARAKNAAPEIEALQKQAAKLRREAERLRAGPHR